MFENNFYKVLFGVPDTILAKLIKFTCEIGNLYSKIYKKIGADLEQKRLEKKKIRQQDKIYLVHQTDLLSDEFSNSDNSFPTVNDLETGRPRITPEKVFIFICLRGYFDSETSVKASKRMEESVSLQIYYFEQNKQIPKPKTINENLNAISSETMTYFYICQFEQFLNEGPDDISYAVLNSTSVHTSSSRETDAAVI